MPDKSQYFWDVLSASEADFVNSISNELAEANWAQPILADIHENGGLTRANKARFFELRFGYALHQLGINLQYEFAGENHSTLDFGFTSGSRNWLVELMRLEETDAVRRATGTTVDEDGIPWTSRTLSTDGEDSRESEEGETIKAIQRICQKCEKDGRPHKFPVPAGAYHVLLVDFRTFLEGGDVDDRIHVGLGGEYVCSEFHRRFWKEKLISGAFSPRTNVRGAGELQNRVHFLGFVNERHYQPGGFATTTQFIANPSLFRDANEVQIVMAGWPLQPVEILNGGG